MDEAKVTCLDCGFEWFGAASAHALRTIGACTRCRGQLSFLEKEPLPPLVEDFAPDVPAHLVLGNPRY